MKTEKTEKITLQEGADFIRLGDLLKLTGEFDTGGQGKLAIQEGQVSVNGEICLMRGKKLRSGDRVEVHGMSFEVC